MAASYCGSGQGSIHALHSAGPVATIRAVQTKAEPVQKDAYTLILEAIDAGVYQPGDRLVESELADRLGVSRTPVREALQRLETQSMLAQDGPKPPGRGPRSCARDARPPQKSAEIRHCSATTPPAITRSGSDPQIEDVPGR